jgi:integration host factor subunit beta
MMARGLPTRPANVLNPFEGEALMSTITKKELIDQIAQATDIKRVAVKRIVQSFLDSIIVELGKGNRLEFRDFGVFEVKHRRARMAQNPKTLDPVKVPPKRTVKFKVGRMMKQVLSDDGEVATTRPTSGERPVQ